MSEFSRGLVVGDFLFSKGGGAQYAQDTKNNLYKRVCPGVYYIAKTREQMIAEAVVGLMRLGLFCLLFLLLGVFDQIISIKALLAWVLLFVYARIGGGK